MRRLSEAAYRLKGQEMFKILARAKELEKEGKKILHFELGDPGFPSPDIALQEIYSSIKNGETHYTISSGIDDLRNQVSIFIENSRGFRPDKEQVLITPGANIQIFYAVACIANPGDEVIVPDPGFVSYFSIIDFCGVKAVRVPLREENNFRLNPQDVENAITERTKMIIINSPSNPTGSVMTPEEIEKIYEIVKKYDLFLVTDEIYRDIIYTNEFPSSPSKFDKCKERTIIIDGVSKRYSMTGWRLGFMIAPEKLIEKMGLLLETTSSCVSPFIQRAVIPVLKKDKAISIENVNELKKRRDLLVQGLNSLPGIKCLNSDGAFYVFPNIKNTGMTGRKFAEYMLEKAGVALSPGDIFGMYADDYVRFSYATSTLEEIQEAIKRMRNILTKLLEQQNQDL